MTQSFWFMLGLIIGIDLGASVIVLFALTNRDMVRRVL